VAVALSFKRRTVWAFAGGLTIFFTGHSAYFYFDLYYGPRFVFETFPWIAVLTAAGVVRFWRVVYSRSEKMVIRKAARIFLLVTVLSGVCIGFPSLCRYYSANYCGNSPQLLELVRERNLRNAGVFLKSLGQFEYGSVMPLNKLDVRRGDVVFARYVPERTEEFMNEYPRDEYWVLEFNILEAAGARNTGPDHFIVDSIRWIPIAPASQEADSQKALKENHP